MNGEIYLNSKPDEGSTFFVNLKTKILRQEKHSDSIISKNTSTSTTAKPLTILIVEDIKHNTLLLTTILKKYAKKFLLAKDGIEAVNIFKENADTIDIILMDLKLPLLNGIEATKMIRRINKEIPIIAITASVYEQDRLQALEAGCTDFIKKPISKEVLFELIPKLISQAKI
jgi:CheY-like chemotaxis protein